MWLRCRHQASVFSLGTICGWSGHKRDLRIVGRRREPTAFLLLHSKDNKDPNMILSPVCEPELSSVFKKRVLNPRSHYKRHIYDFELNVNLILSSHVGIRSDNSRKV